MEVNLEDNSTPQASASTNKKGLNGQDEDWESLPAERSVKPKPTVHYIKSDYRLDPQTKDYFIRDTNVTEINISKPFLMLKLCFRNS